MGTPFANGTVRIVGTNGSLLRVVNIEERRTYDVQIAPGTYVLEGMVTGEPRNPVRASVAANRTAQVKIQCRGK